MAIRFCRRSLALRARRLPKKLLVRDDELRQMASQQRGYFRAHVPLPSNVSLDGLLHIVDHFFVFIAVHTPPPPPLIRGVVLGIVNHAVVFFVVLTLDVALSVDLVQLGAPPAGNERGRWRGRQGLGKQRQG